jgi:hypothetical protein
MVQHAGETMELKQKTSTCTTYILQTALSLYSCKMSAWKCSSASSLLQWKFSIICINICASILHKFEWGIALTYLVIKVANWSVSAVKLIDVYLLASSLPNVLLAASASQSWWAVLFSFCTYFLWKMLFLFLHP